MKLSTKSRYGTRAMTEIARGWPDRPVTRREIAELQRIPDSYLENILVSLKESGLVTTIRGARGGYRLAQPPEEITVLMIVEALQGPIIPVPCTDPRYSCESSASCRTASVWSRMYHAIQEVLEKHSLSDLIREETQEEFIDFII